MKMPKHDHTEQEGIVGVCPGCVAEAERKQVSTWLRALSARSKRRTAETPFLSAVDAASWAEQARVLEMQFERIAEEIDLGAHYQPVTDT